MERFTYAGRWYAVRDAPCEPKPVQRPLPPIWMGETNNPAMVRAIARHADVFNSMPVSTEGLRRKLAVLEEACRGEGRDVGTLGRSLETQVLIARSDAESRLGKSMNHSMKGEQALHDLEPLHPLGAVLVVRRLEGEAVGVELGPAPAVVVEEDDPPARDDVERGDHLGRERGIAERVAEVDGREPEPRGHAGEGGEQRPALEDGAVSTEEHVVCHEQRIVPERFALEDGIAHRRPLEPLPARGAEEAHPRVGEDRDAEAEVDRHAAASLPRQVATVDEQRRRRDERCLVGGEEEDRVRHLARRTHPAEYVER